MTWRGGRGSTFFISPLRINILSLFVAVKVFNFIIIRLYFDSFYRIVKVMMTVTISKSDNDRGRRLLPAVAMHRFRFAFVGFSLKGGRKKRNTLL
jgi:hypothetical protein